MPQSTITVDVHLDKDKVPDQINWTADNSSAEAMQKAKAMMLSFWDGGDKSALRIDLWTKDMMVDEMKVFMHQTLVSMANTLERATQEDKMAADLRDFCDHFAEKLELKDPNKGR